MSVPHDLSGREESRSRGSPVDGRQDGRRDGRLQVILNRLRITRLTSRIYQKNSGNRSQGWRLGDQHSAPLPMQALKSKTKRRDGHDSRNGGASRHGFFTRILRHAHSKKDMRHPRAASGQCAVISENQAAINDADGADQPGQTAAPERETLAHTASTLKQQQHRHSPTNLIAEPTQCKNPSEPWEPKHAATDFADVAVSPGEKRAKRRSLLQAQASSRYNGSPSAEDLEDRRDERPRTVETMDPARVRGDSGVDDAANSTLLTPSQRRHSKLRSAQGATGPCESSEEPSDYQRFVQQAVDDDRHEREQLWQTIANPPGKKKKKKDFVPNHPDLNLDFGLLERSGTFGGPKREKNTSNKRNSNAWKRASNISQQSRSEKRRSYITGVETLDSEKWSAARRVSEYIKPPRD
ncbi:hypothetical protein BJ170DRAFT_595134 [Xylariales sp. AK1849]|nr:hypothetical protein BJ170DRAFT_595134 [Xylariales sp. AK1849]